MGDKRKRKKLDYNIHSDGESDFEILDHTTFLEGLEDYDPDKDTDFDDFDPDEEEQVKKHKGKKKLPKVLLIILAVILALYFGSTAFFSKHFFPNTTINGNDFSVGTVAQVESYMEHEVENYTLTLKESDGDTEVIDGSAISLEYTKDGSVEKLLKKQNSFLWFTALWDAPEIEASIGAEYDETQLDTVITNMMCMQADNQTAAVSAQPEFNGTEFVVKEEQIGTQIDNDIFKEKISEAIAGFQPELDLTEAGCYIQPKYTKDSEEVTTAVETMNKYLQANITLDFSPSTEVVDASVISQWVTVDENMQVTFNQDAVKTYIAELASKYDTAGKTRIFTTATGNTVEVSGGSYGWKIDQDAEYTALIANIENGETITREPNYSQRAATHDTSDIGNTYAELDLTNQHVYFFQDGQCVLSTDVVTGNESAGNGTPQGVYTIAYKQTDQVLRGEKLANGEYEWESPVKYWMPFNGGIGFHDASWRSVFGGSIYQTNGSHGCVNMPTDAAAQLYELVQSGTVVVCHY